MVFLILKILFDSVCRWFFHNSVHYKYTCPFFFFSEYFSPHVGEYINVLSALEKLNVAILKAMDKTKEVSGFNLFADQNYA